MGEGKGLSMYMLIGAIMFGLFVGVGATAIFGDGVGSFEGGLVETAPDPNEGGGIVEDDPNCVIATDEDFSGTSNGEFIYIGSDDCVKIPHVIKGVEVTSYKNMFSETKVSKVISDNLNVTDMGGMFLVSKATELDLSSFDTRNVTDMSWMFSGSQATELDLSSFNTSKVTDMSWMFAYSEATELDLSNFDTSKVTSMSSMFMGSQATELDLSRFNTSNVTYMSLMFYGSEATELDLSSFDTRNVRDMDYMFEGSQSKTVYARTQSDADKFNESSEKPIGLQAVVKDREPNEGIVEDDPNCVLATDEDFRDTVNDSFKYIGSSDCVRIPHVIKGVEVTSYQFMFDGTSVSKVVSDNPNVTDMSLMFSGSEATELDVSSIDTSNVTDMSGMFWGSKATELDLSNFNTSKVTNMSSMFQNSQAIELDLSSFDTRNVIYMSYMFYNSQATELDLSSFDTSNVTGMKEMFRDTKATVLDLSSFDTSKVTDMSWMFGGSQATELDLSSFDTSNVTRMSSMFFESQATELDLSSFDTSNVTNMRSMFWNSKSTVNARTQGDADNFNASINQPLGLQIIDKDREPNEGIVEDDPNCVLATDEDFSGTSNGEFRYIGSSDCVEIPHEIKGVEVTSYQFMFSGTSVSKVLSDNLNVTNMQGMFNKSQATKLDLSSFNTSNVTDMSGMFSESQVTELDLSSFDTSNVTDMEWMFYSSQAKTVNARTQADADKFNASGHIPDVIQVIVKQ